MADLEIDENIAVAIPGDFGDYWKKGCTSSKHPGSRNARNKIDITKIMQALMEDEKDEFPTPHNKEDEWWNDLYRGVEFYDDVKNYQPLIKDKVIAARRLEIAFFKKMGVYTKVPRRCAVDKKGEDHHHQVDRNKQRRQRKHRLSVSSRWSRDQEG